MYLDVITYKGEKIARNSDAFQLYQAKKFKELDAHMAQLEKNFRKLEGKS